MTDEAEERMTGEEGSPQAAPQPGPDSAQGSDQGQDHRAADAENTAEQSAGESAGSADEEQAAASQPDELQAARQEAAERTADLQRLQAEFVNYKRRVERDRELVRENAVYAVLSPMLDVLDSIDRAREAGELEGGFKGVADQLERIVTNLGLNRFGEPGDEFDPTRHEALSHVGTDPEVTVPTCKHIAKAGYAMGGRVVRAAQVLVVDPAEPSVE